MSKKSKITTTGRLAAYLKQNMFMTSVFVIGIVAVVAIAGVLAANNGQASKQPTVSTDNTGQADDAKKDAGKDVATAPASNTTTDQITEVLGQDTAAVAVQSQAPSTQVAVVTAPAPVVASPTPAQIVDTPVIITPTDSQANSQADPQDPGTAPTDPAGPATPTDPIPANAAPADTSKFGRALVSLTFDDGWKSIHDNGLPILTKYGLQSTQYINGDPTLKSDPTSPLYDNWTGYMNSQHVKNFAAAGHEIAWHTNTHAYDLTTATPEQRTAELTPTTDFLNLLMAVNVTMTDNLAAPFGTQNAESADAAKAAGYNSYRTTYDGYNTKANFDLMNIKVKNVCGVANLDACNMKVTTAAEVASWIAEAQAQNAWLVIVYHEVADTAIAGPDYSVTVGEFDAQMDAVKQSGAAVVTVQQAIAELKTQL